MSKSKAQIAHLTIVGGSSTSGKSTLIRRFKKNRLSLSELFQNTQIPSQFFDIHHTNLHLIESEEINHLIVHYDLTSRDVLERNFLQINSLIERSNQIQIITLASPAETLKKRTRKRLLKELGMHGLKLWRIDYQRLRWLIKKWSSYRYPLTVLQRYANWHQFTSSQKIGQHILITENNFPNQTYNYEAISNIYTTEESRSGKLTARFKKYMEAL